MHHMSVDGNRFSINACRLLLHYFQCMLDKLHETRTDVMLFAFLEGYLSKLENPLAVQVWSRYLALAKDIASNVKEFRPQAYPVLR